MKNIEQTLLLGISILCAGLMIGILIGRLQSNNSVSLSAYDRTIADQPAATAPRTDETEGKININTASAKELAMLPGIGSIYAERIVQYRQEHGPFLKIQELKDISGIGADRFNKIKDYITVGD